jgi:hypothetical protein
MARQKQYLTNLESKLETQAQLNDGFKERKDLNMAELNRKRAVAKYHYSKDHQTFH